MIAPPSHSKRRRRRVDVSFRLEEAKTTAEALKRELARLELHGQGDSTEAHRCERALSKVRRGIRYVVEVNPTRPHGGQEGAR